MQHVQSEMNHLPGVCHQTWKNPNFKYSELEGINTVQKKKHNQTPPPKKKQPKQNQKPPPKNPQPNKKTNKQTKKNLDIQTR